MSDPIRALESLRQQFEQDLASAGTEADLRALRDKYLSRKGGLVSGLLKSLGSAPADDRPRLGQLANALKSDIDDPLTGRIDAAAQARPPKGAVDVTLPGRRAGDRSSSSAQPAARAHRGDLHPPRLPRHRRPELEDDYHNFEALNMPPEHPARDMQDTLYLQSPVRSLGRHRRDAAADAHVRHADPLHGDASAAGAR